MKKRNITLFTAIAAAAAFASSAQAAIVLEGGYTGPYRLAFQTTNQYDAVPTAIGTYNDRVQAVADATSGNAIDLSTITDWKMIGSTVAANAKVNTGTTATDGLAASGDVPIYNVNGELIAAGNAALWGATPTTPLLARIVSQTGSNTTSRMWTGTQPDGTAWAGNELGATQVGQGNGFWDGTASTSETGTWISWGQFVNGNPNPQANNYAHYALSPVQNIPEPTSLSLLALGGLALLRRRRA